MSTPVITSKWAGNFDCSVCRRKRLMAQEFSKSSLEKHRKTGQTLRCKDCTAKQEKEEREKAREKATAKATAKAKNGSGDRDENDENDEKRTCAGPCHRMLPRDSYNRNQWSKPEGKSRCRECVERSIQEESQQQKSKTRDAIETARKKVQDLGLSKKATAQEIVAAESELAALEAEKVTGLKPIRLGGGRGRGRGGRRGGSGRGSSSRTSRTRKK